MISEDTEWWWIDFLEREMEPQIEQDMVLLLEHSQRDQKTFDDFQLIRKWTKDSEPAKEVMWTGAELNHLQLQIMKQIEEEPNSRPPSRLSNESL